MRVINDCVGFNVPFAEAVLAPFTLASAPQPAAAAAAASQPSVGGGGGAGGLVGVGAEAGEGGHVIRGQV